MSSRKPKFAVGEHYLAIRMHPATLADQELRTKTFKLLMRWLQAHELKNNPDEFTPLMQDGICVLEGLSKESALQLQTELDEFPGWHTCVFQITVDDGQRRSPKSA